MVTANCKIVPAFFVPMCFMHQKYTYLLQTTTFHQKPSAVWPAVSPKCQQFHPNCSAVLVSSFTKLLSSFPQTAEQFGGNCQAVWREIAEQADCVQMLPFFVGVCINSSPLFLFVSFLVLDFYLKPLIFKSCFWFSVKPWHGCCLDNTMEHHGHACGAKKMG